MAISKKKALLTAAIAACMVAALALLAACGGGTSSASSSSKSESFKSEATETSTSTLTTVYGEQVSAEPTGVKNILVIGDDSWEQYVPGHADMMCLLRVDFDNHSITEVTIPRDTRWEFADGTVGKLEYEFTNAGGGDAGSVAQAKACGEVLGEHIDYYVTIGFDALEKIVDHFGGVYVDLPYGVEYSFYTGDYPNERFNAGPQTLDAWHAMVISRTRTGYGESGVGEPDLVRQYIDRMMLTQFMHDGYQNPEGLSALFTLLSGMTQSNIPADVMTKWAEAMASSGKIVVKGTTGPFYGDIDPNSNDQWIVLPDQAGWNGVMSAVNANKSVAEIADAVTTTFANPNFPPEIPPCTEVTITPKK